jgi:hypothetical protein
LRLALAIAVAIAECINGFAVRSTFWNFTSSSAASIYGQGRPKNCMRSNWFHICCGGGSFRCISSLSVASVSVKLCCKKVDHGRHQVCMEVGLCRLY